MSNIPRIPRGLSEKAALTKQFLKRKMEEYEVLKAGFELLEQVASDRGHAGLDP